MRKLLLVISMCVYYVNLASATNYHFSNSSGNDSRTIAEAANPSTPWKTLNKLNSIFKSLKPGDFLLLKRGDSFDGSITVSKSGTSFLNIVIGAYGTGAQPVVTGLAALNWVSLGNNKYESQQLLLNSINLVTRNGVPLPMGRWPNDDQPVSGYKTISSHTWNGSSHTGSISSPSIAGAPGYSNGAELVMRVKHFVIDRDIITSHTSSKINFKAVYDVSLKYPPNNKYGFYLQNDPGFLDKQHEWWYSPTKKKVMIYSKTGAPTGVKATRITDLVTISGFSYITFDNISFEGANAVIFNLSSNTSHITIQNSTLNCSGVDGIYNSAPYTSIKNNVINNCLNRSIYSKGTNAYIGHNKISNTATIIGMGESGDGNYIGINLRQDNSLVEYNKVTKTGYSAIYLASTCNNSTIQFNRVDSFCLIKNDGAGIYCYSRGAICHGRKIFNNIVSNGGVGRAVDGSDKAYTPNNRAEAIYCDQETSGISIRNNTLFNCYRGLFINPGCNAIDAQWNTTYNNYLYEFYLNVGASSGDGKDPKMFGNTIKNNTYVAVRSSTVTGYFMTQGWSMATAGLIDNNCYARPLDDNRTMFNNGSLVTLASWKTAHPTFDMHSKKSPKSISRLSDISLEFNETSTPRTIKLSSKCIDMTGKAYSGSITLQPYTSIVLIKTGASVAARKTGTSDSTGIAVDFNGTVMLPGTKSFTIIGTAYDTTSLIEVAGKLKNVELPASVNPGNELLFVANPRKLLNTTISPNPAVDGIVCNFSSAFAGQRAAILTILNVNGAVIQQHSIVLSGSKLYVDVSALQTGVYLLNLYGDDFTVSKKFVKAH